MLFWIVSIFIPYSVTQKPTIPVVTREDLEVTGGNYTFALAVSDLEKDSSIVNEWISISVYFHGKAKFVIVDPKAGQLLSKDHDCDLPAVFAYFNGFMLGCYRCLDNDVPLLYLIDRILTGPPDPAKSVAELCGNMSPVPFVLIVPPNLTKRGMLLQYKAGSQMGPVDVIPVEPHVLMSMGVDGNSMALFRAEDMCVVPIQGTIDGLYEASYPVYRTLMVDDIRGTDQIIVALAASEIGEEEQGFLFELGLRFPSFVVGWANDDIIPYVEQVTGQQFTGIPVFAVFNFDASQHWDSSHWFTEQLLSEPFNSAKWLTAATQMLRSIEAGELKGQYLSEEEPANNDGVVKVLVGTTYTDFVMNPEKDVVVLYKRQNCPHCEAFGPQFKAFAEECRAAQLDFLAFATIDVTKNSASMRYPYMAGVPHVHIFPAKNKTGGDALRGGRDRNTIIRWLKKYATAGTIPFDAPPPDKKQIAGQLLQILVQAKSMPPEEQTRAMQWIQEQTELAGIAPKQEEL